MMQLHNPRNTVLVSFSIGFVLLRWPGLITTYHNLILLKDVSLKHLFMAISNQLCLSNRPWFGQGAQKAMAAARTRVQATWAGGFSVSHSRHTHLNGHNWVLPIELPEPPPHRISIWPLCGKWMKTMGVYIYIFQRRNKPYEYIYIYYILYIHTWYVHVYIFVYVYIHTYRYYVFQPNVGELKASLRTSPRCRLRLRPPKRSVQCWDGTTQRDFGAVTG